MPNLFSSWCLLHTSFLGRRCASHDPTYNRRRALSCNVVSGGLGTSQTHACCRLASAVVVINLPTRRLSISESLRPPTMPTSTAIFFALPEHLAKLCHDRMEYLQHFSIYRDPTCR
ncbi:hypothetical protein BDZ89DRAFT_798207 [Hymenopellis radicata]|nr:hypothetical protein BDZ89DRAFT_798207 [Hymenopellis radicata]